MKYTAGVLGLLLVSSCVWAESEKMTMYATLSAPIGSFWQVETKTCDPVVMPADSQLNLGNVSTADSVGSSGGSISIQGTAEPLAISTLRMEKGSVFTVSNNARWMVSTLKIAPMGTFIFKGNLIAEPLTLKNMTNPTTIKANTLRLGQNITVKERTEIGRIQTGSCGSDAFCLDDSSGPSTATWSSVSCSKNENNACHPEYWLVGG